MAGSLLLVSKQADDFNNVISTLEENIKRTYSKYFTIKSHRLGNDAFLVEFRKDKENKFFQDDKGNWLCYEGTVFALRETKAYTAQDLLELYLEDAEAFPNQLDGHFVIKLYCAETGEYRVVNDYIKNKTNFICDTEDYLMFTPFSITAAAIAPVVIDPEALNEFLWRYYILSHKTLLADVSRLKPASVYAYSQKKLSRTSYWQWPKQYTQQKFNDCVGQMCDSMQESARLVLSKFKNPCADFTMGQDTKHVISAFTSQGLDFTTSIYGKSDFYEVQKVGEHAKQLGMTHVNIQLSDDYVQNPLKYFTQGLMLSSCEEPGYLIGRIMHMRQQQAKHGDVCLNGVDGHFYKNGLWDEQYTFNLYREPKAFNVDTFLSMRALSSDYDDRLFSPAMKEVKANSRQYFKAIIDNSIKDHLESPVSIQVDKFDLHHWLNFANAGNNAGNMVHHSLSPLLLRRNMDLALQIPVKWKFNLSRFQRAVVYTMDKRLAELKTDFGGVTMVPKNALTYLPFITRYFLFQTKRLRDKVKSKLGFNVVSHLQEAWDYAPIYKTLLEQIDIAKYRDAKTMAIHSVLDAEQWSAFLAKYDSPEELSLKDYEYLLKILSVEMLMSEAKGWKL